VRTVRVHATNVTGAGLGAARLVQSLLPALERCGAFHIAEIYLPDRGELSGYKRISEGIEPSRYSRIAPNAISRLLECTLFSGAFDGDSPLLVLGDLPLRSRSVQILFVQSPFVAGADTATTRTDRLKYWIADRIFRANCRFVARIIVQTTAIQTSLEQLYPTTKGMITVIPQPPPEWVVKSGLQRHAKTNGSGAGLRLFYPAASYPHKNHALLSRLNRDMIESLPIRKLILTVPAENNPDSSATWIECVGTLTPSEVLENYRRADALLFLSKSESYGLPLVEAMWIGLPIICPNLTYARILCSDQAIYFDPLDTDSLSKAIHELQSRLSCGWWPDWREQLLQIPRSWDDVARSMLHEIEPIL